MKEKLVPSRWLESADRRLDTGPYLSGKMEILELLANLNVPKQPLSALTIGHNGGIYNGPQFVRNYVLDSRFGVPFLTSSAFLRADLSLVPMLRRKDAESRELSFLRVQPDMTLISCSGTTGRMAFASNAMANAWSSQDIMKVMPDRERIGPGYVYAFLASKFGVPLITGDTYGSMIPHLEPQHIARLPIPRLGDAVEQHAHNKVSEAATLRTEYQEQIRVATRRLFETVGLEDVTTDNWHNGTPDLGFVRKIDTAASLRALNFNPQFVALCDSVKTQSWRPLGELCLPGTLRNGPRFKRIDAEPEYSYQLIGQKEIFWLRPKGRWIARRATPEACLVPEGTSLVASHGTFGESELYCRAEFIWGDVVARAYSQDFLRVIPNPQVILPGCMFAFLRSETAFRMFRSVSIGTKLQEHHPRFTQQLPVPYPDERARHDIHELVVNAYDKRQQSVRLEDEAIAVVERAIEGAM